MGAPVLVADAVSKTYQSYSKPHDRLLQGVLNRMGSDRHLAREIHALRPLSFAVDAGETLAVIGRNGSGKSTLLQLLAGTVTPTTGAVHAAGRLAAILELGTGFNLEYTGRENYRINAAILGLTPGEVAAVEDSVIEFADIGEFIDEPVRTYSSGMYVRLAFAVSVHVTPDILLIDEALAVGDVFFQQKCFDFLKREFSDVAKVLVTHDLASVAKLADRVLVLEGGELVFEGEPVPAIELYTSLSHRSWGGGAVEPVELASAVATGESDLSPVGMAQSSNPELFAFTGVSATIDGVGAHGGPDTSIPVRDGQTVAVRLAYEARVPVDEPIVGYLVRDRVGNAVFGMNTIGHDQPVPPLRAGRGELELRFSWPEAADGDYTLTVGLGDGTHPLHHRVISWGQGLLAFTSIPDRDVHGMINHDYDSLSIRQFDEATPSPGG